VIAAERRGGPLVGLRVVEFVGIGPGPHCGMLLSDLGAEVLRIDREGGNGWPNPVVDRGRATLTLDVRSEAGVARCLEIADHVDVVIEGFRPGTMERLGLGPDALLARNPRLVFGRITGWGQTGPLAKVAGHDINYIALTGALAAIGKPGEAATPPLNLVGDFGGGSMLLAFGIVSALWERERSGKGQVVDAAMVDGVSSLMSMFAGLLPSGRIAMERESNMLGGAAPFYRCYLCADGTEIAIGAIEPHFYAQLLARIGAPAELLDRQHDQAHWPADSALLATLFGARTAAEWRALLEDSDACFAPVVPLAEAPRHPHLAERQVYVSHDGLEQVGPVPRFSRTPGTIQSTRDGDAMIAAWRENADRV
jgi:alpha-methylacyl-CoA racemase